MPAWLASMTQLPGWPKVTRDPEIEQAEFVEEGSMLNVTGFPEPPPVAVTLYSTSLRGTEVKVIDWAIFVPFTVMVCWAWGAAWYLSLPAWLASMTQLPVLLKVTLEPMIEHTEALPGSMLRITGLPDPPPEAVTA